MLVITRRRWETVDITGPDGTHVRVHVVAGGPVRLGFEAERCVSIRRTEVADNQKTEVKDDCGKGT